MSYYKRLKDVREDRDLTQEDIASLLQNNVPLKRVYASLQNF